MTLVTSETEGVKRDIAGKQEAHERLTVQVHKTQGEVDSMNKQLEQLNIQHEELREDFAHNERIMKETEKNLDHATAVSRHNPLASPPNNCYTHCVLCLCLATSATQSRNDAVAKTDGKRVG